MLAGTLELPGRAGGRAAVTGGEGLCLCRVVLNPAEEVGQPGQPQHRVPDAPGDSISRMGKESRPQKEHGPSDQAAQLPADEPHVARLRPWWSGSLLPACAARPCSRFIRSLARPCRRDRSRFRYPHDGQWLRACPVRQAGQSRPGVRSTRPGLHVGPILEESRRVRYGGCRYAQAQVVAAAALLARPPPQRGGDLGDPVSAEQPGGQQVRRQAAAPGRVQDASR